MSAAATLQAANADGVRFSLSSVGKLKAIGEAPVVERWAPQIQAHKVELIALLRKWERLQAAIIACCEARGDTDEHRAALLADCLREEPADWGWWTNYFEHEMRR